MFKRVGSLSRTSTGLKGSLSFWKTWAVGPSNCDEKNETPYRSCLPMSWRYTSHHLVSLQMFCLLPGVATIGIYAIWLKTLPHRTSSNHGKKHTVSKAAFGVTKSWFYWSASWRRFMGNTRVSFHRCGGTWGFSETLAAITTLLRTPDSKKSNVQVAWLKVHRQLFFNINNGRVTGLRQLR